MTAGWSPESRPYLWEKKKAGGVAHGRRHTGSARFHPSLQEEGGRQREKRVRRWDGHHHSAWETIGTRTQAAPAPQSCFSARHFLKHFLGDVKIPMEGGGHARGVGVCVTRGECVAEVGLEVHSGLCRPSGGQLPSLPMPTPSEACLVSSY